MPNNMYRCYHLLTLLLKKKTIALKVSDIVFFILFPVQQQKNKKQLMKIASLVGGTTHAVNVAKTRQVGEKILKKYFASVYLWLWKEFEVAANVWRKFSRLKIAGLNRRPQIWWLNKRLLNKHWVEDWNQPQNVVFKRDRQLLQRDSFGQFDGDGLRWRLECDVVRQRHVAGVSWNYYNKKFFCFF